MSIASVITRGFISGINFIPTRGYASVEASTTGGIPHNFTYVPAYQRQESIKREEIRKEKTEVQKVTSVIGEYERKLAIVDESVMLATKKEQARLLKTQNELITEINRLLMVKAEMMARIKRQEEQLFLMIVIRRKKLRAI